MATKADILPFATWLVSDWSSHLMVSYPEWANFGSWPIG